MKQRIEALNEDEAAWITQNVEIAKKLVAAYAGEASQLDPAALDRAGVGWSAHGEDDRVEPNVLANALGIAFGQYLVQTLHMTWAVVTDEHGTDIAVRGAPSDMLVFPTAATAKRIANGDLPFFTDLYEQLSSDIAKIRRRVQ
jgi:hypothetical protein